MYIKPRTESEVFLTKREECVYTIFVFISSITRFGILTDLIIVGAVVISKSLGAAIFIRDFQTVILAVKNIIAGVILSIRSAFIRGVLTELELFAAVGRANAFAGQKAAVKIRNNLGVIALRDIIVVERIIDQPLCRSGRIACAFGVCGETVAEIPTAQNTTVSAAVFIAKVIIINDAAVINNTRIFTY